MKIYIADSHPRVPWLRAESDTSFITLAKGGVTRRFRSRGKLTRRLIEAAKARPQQWRLRLIALSCPMVERMFHYEDLRRW